MNELDRMTERLLIRIMKVVSGWALIPTLLFVGCIGVHYAVQQPGILRLPGEPIPSPVDGAIMLLSLMCITVPLCSFAFAFNEWKCGAIPRDKFYAEWQRITVGLTAFSLVIGSPILLLALAS